MAAFEPVDDATGLGADTAAEVSHADSVTNQILQASVNFQNLSQSRYPLLLRSSSLLLLTHSTLPIQIHAIVVFQVVIVNPSITHGRPPTNSLNRIESFSRSGGRQQTGSLRNRTPPSYVPIKPKGATRGKMRKQSLKRSPHAHNPKPGPKSLPRNPTITIL